MPEPEVKPPNNADRFGGPGPGRPKGSKSKAVPPRQLQDMRYVYRTEKAGADFPADTPGRAVCRTLCRENPQNFLALLQKMETEFRTARGKAEKADATKIVGPSEGTKDIVDLIDRLMDEFEEAA